MSWKWYPTKEDESGLKRCEYEGNWWTDKVNCVAIQLTNNTVQELYRPLKKAFIEKKPWLFRLVNVRSKWRKIEAKIKGEAFSIQLYSNNISLNPNPDLFNNLSENCVHCYYAWEEVPKALKLFILNQTKRNKLSNPNKHNLIDIFTSKSLADIVTDEVISK